MSASTIHTKFDRGLGLKIIYNVLEVTLSSFVSRPRSLFWQFNNSRCRRRSASAHSSLCRSCQPCTSYGVIIVFCFDFFFLFFFISYLIICSDFGYDDSALVFIKLQLCRVTVRTGWTRVRWKCPLTSIISRIYLRSEIKIS